MNLVLVIVLFPILALLVTRLVLRYVVPLEEAVSPAQQEAVVPAQEEVTQTDLSSYTVKDLRALAKERGLKGVSQLKKADLIKRLQ